MGTPPRVEAKKKGRGLSDKKMDGSKVIVAVLLLLLLIYFLRYSYREYAKPSVSHPSHPQQPSVRYTHRYPFHNLDDLSRGVEAEWKTYFPSASIMPGIGLPSQNKQNWLLLTHQPNNAETTTISGVPCKSPLCMNALYSSELHNGTWLNLYEIMVPEIAGRGGEPSTSQKYVNALQRAGLDVSAIHFHWTSSVPYMTAVHHYNIGMHPLDFSQRTIRALGTVMPLAANLPHH